MSDKDFDFEASFIVHDVCGYGEFTSDTGYSRMKIFPQGMKPIDVAVKDVTFIISPVVNAKTYTTLYDAGHMVMAFPDEDNLVHYFRKWQIHLELLEPENRTRPPEPEPQQPVKWDDDEITLTDFGT